MSDPNYTRRPYRTSLVWPILLIGVGVYFLLINMNLLRPQAWIALVRLWPVALILIGVDILFGRRSLIGSLFSSLIALVVVGGIIWLVMVGPEKVPGFAWLTAVPEVQSKNIQTPLGEVKTAEVTINWGTGVQKLNALPSGSQNLLEGDVNYYDNLVFDVNTNKTFSTINLDTKFASSNFLRLEWVDTDWAISLNPAVTYDLRMDTGSGQNNFDLSQLKLSNLVLDSGSGSARLDLPGGNYKVAIDSGSGSLTISLPEDVGARIIYNHGSGHLGLPAVFKLESGEVGDDGVWKTANFDSAAQQVSFVIDQGSGSINFTLR
jgi:hypothetical protein